MFGVTILEVYLCPPVGQKQSLDFILLALAYSSWLVRRKSKSKKNQILCNLKICKIITVSICFKNA